MLTTHITNTHTYTHALPLWLQQSVRYEPIKLVCISLKREAEGEHALYYRRNVGTKSLCKFALRRSTDPPPSRRLHGTSVFTLSVSALIYSILLGLVCVCVYAAVRIPPTILLTTKAFLCWLNSSVRGGRRACY